MPWRTFSEDARLQRLFRDNFDQLTPENELKWANTEPLPGVFTFDEADQLVSYATAHGKRIRGHTLVWGNQLPKWVRDGHWSRDSLLLFMREHIDREMSRYRGRINEWDVVNEAIAGNGGYEQNVFLRVIGPKYVEYAFRYAHAADPDAKLYYNDMGIGLPGHPATLGVLRMVADLKRKGVPIHGIGIQAHMSTRYHLSQSQVADTMRRVAELGLDVAITEMDVRINSPGTPAQRLEDQRRVYEGVARACRAQPRCTSFTTWGISDKHSWLGQSAVPLAFDSAYRAKPAWPTIVRALRE